LSAPYSGGDASNVPMIENRSSAQRKRAGSDVS
jgi:hypothetical protein